MSARRAVRLRKEYLYRKSLEGKEKVDYERKRLVKKALDEGKPIPTELRKDFESIKHTLDLDDESTFVPKSHIDDEYAAYRGAPKVCITTSRDPSSRLKQFSKELRLLFPESQRINRGNHQMSQIIEACKSGGFSDVVVVQETRGEPDGLVVCHLPFGPTAFFTLSNCVLRHDIEDRGTVSEVYPHLIFDGFATDLGVRTKSILQHLFPVPKEASKRVITFANNKDYISFRHHTFTKQGKEVALTEVGPRFEMYLYMIRLGTIDQDEAETEWVLRPYMNTARKRQAL